MNSIQDQQLNLPSEVPIMVLPGTMLFPNALLPLFIFEPRYREMLAHALDRDRMFCVASTYPGIEEAEDIDDLRAVSGLGLVRACVGREDGTSHLVLQGLARVRFRGFVQQSPFKIAQIQELPSVLQPGDDVDEIGNELRDLCRSIQTGEAEEREKLNEQLTQIADFGILADVVAHTFLRDPEHRQEALETLDIARRLSIVLEFLRGEVSG